MPKTPRRPLAERGAACNGKARWRLLLDLFIALGDERPHAHHCVHQTLIPQDLNGLPCRVTSNTELLLKPGFRRYRELRLQHPGLDPRSQHVRYLPMPGNVRPELIGLIAHDRTVGGVI